MYGRGDIGKIRRCPILTWLFKNLKTYFQWEDPSPFRQSLWQHPRHPYVAIQTTGRPRQTSRINSPPRIHIVKLVPGISPPLLNRFLRFRRRCNLLMNTFPTVYNMTLDPKGISEEE